MARLAFLLAAVALPAVARASFTQGDVGHARARKREQDGEETWDEHVKVEEARTFVGLGVTCAAKQLRDAIVGGESAPTSGSTAAPRRAPSRRAGATAGAGRRAAEVRSRHILPARP